MSERMRQIRTSMSTKEEYDAVYLLSKVQYMSESEEMAGCTGNFVYRASYRGGKSNVGGAERVAGEKRAAAQKICQYERNVI